MRRGLVTASVVLLSAVLVPRALSGERLPVTIFTSAEGLPGDTVTALLQDRSGLLWVGTSVGLSRFDGQAFVSYGASEGLSRSGVSELLEDGDGTLWAISGGEVVRMLERRDADGRLFVPCELAGEESRPTLFDLHEDAHGELWLTAGHTLYRHDRGRDRFEPVPIAVPPPAAGDSFLVALASGADGSLWIRADHGLVRRLADGRTAFYPVPRGANPPNAGILSVDEAGRLWLVGDSVLAFLPEAESPGMMGHPLERVLRRASDWSQASRPSRPGEAVAFEPVRRLGSERIFALHVTRNGALWIAGDRLHVAESGELRTLSHAHGIPGYVISTLLEDRDGSLWIGTESGGLARLDRSGLSSWGIDEGLSTVKVGALVHGPGGEVMPLTFPACEAVHRLAGDRFEPFRFALPAEVASCGWGENQVAVVDRAGEWWVATFHGVLRFPRPARLEALPVTPPRARYGTAHGLADERVFRLYEDASARIWASVFAVDGRRLARFDRARERFIAYGAEQGLPPDAPSAFADGPDGSLWIGFYGFDRAIAAGGVARFRDGRFRYFPPSPDGLPAGFVSALLVDARGRLWAAVLGSGLWRLDEPDHEPPVWRRFGATEGLGAADVLALAEDRLGRIYAGTRRGVDRVDPESGRVRHFDRSSGLANDGVVAMTLDGAGDLWIATAGGISRLRPGSDPPTAAPPARFAALRVAGRAVPLPELGVAELTGLTLAPGDRHVEVELSAIDLQLGDRPVFRYRLGDLPWVTLTAGERRLHLAGLAPGAYKLEARAVLADGRSGTPAMLSLVVEPPLWKKPWFQGTLLLLVAGLVWSAVRQRLARLREIQAVRARIAADLHDDLGLSLSRVAMLAEMTRPGLAPGSAADTALEEIAASARELVDSTSDVAWALDPAKDDLPSLLGRLRRLGGEICEGAGVEFRFCAPEAGAGIVLRDERRRHLYLILKEAVHNAVRHGGPSRLLLSVRLEGDRLHAEVSDDGCGFDLERVEADGGGHGLSSLRRRADQLGGTMAIESRPGSGTTVRLEIPLAVR